jgi:hypothetical protein
VSGYGDETGLNPNGPFRARTIPVRTLTSRHSTQGSTQSFFLHLVEHKRLARAGQIRGKFRSFLLGSLQSHLSSEADRARCLKTGRRVEFVALDMQDAEDRYKLEPVDALTPEKVRSKLPATFCWRCVRILSCRSHVSLHS